MRPMTFAEKISKFCEAKGWNRAELARRCGVSRTTAGYWFDDVRKPFDDKLSTLSQLFGVTVDYLVDDAQDAPPGPMLTREEEELLRAARRLSGGAEEALRRVLNFRELAPAMPNSVSRTTVISRDEAQKAREAKGA